MKKQRNIKREKGLLCYLVFLNYIFELGMVTIIIYLCATLSLRYMGGLNLYFYGILAGLTGGLWGVGIQKILELLEKIEKTEEWFPTKKSFRRRLHHWFLRFFLLFWIYVGLGFIISFFELY